MEAYWLINFCLDLVFLWLGHRFVMRIRWKRLLLSAGLGASLACLAAKMTGATGILTAAAGLMVMCLSAVGFSQAPALLVRVLFHALLTGGAAAIVRRMPGGLSLPGPVTALLLSPLGLLLTPERPIRHPPRLYVPMALSARGHTVRLTALVDTGNRLREPISALPVLVAEEARLLPLLPPEYGQTPLPRGFRLVCYGGLGGSGQMLCFPPDRILILRDGKWKSAPHMWVALYPGKLPGRVQALAPEKPGIY